MQSEVPTEFEIYEIVGESSTLKSVLRQAIDAAKTEVPVLIVGEAGSGKELIARAIHRLGSRRRESFIKVDCAIVAPPNWKPCYSKPIEDESKQQTTEPFYSNVRKMSRRGCRRSSSRSSSRRTSAFTGLYNLTD